MKSRYVDALVVLVLIAACAIRIFRIDYPFAFGWGDGEKSYLVARHIVHFKEFPLTGPYGQLYESGLRTSPVYYYLLGFLLVFNTSIFVLSFANVFLQVIFLLVIYVFTKYFFGVWQGFLTVILLAFNPGIVDQSFFIWSPYVMQPLLYLSIFLYLVAIKKERSIYLYAGSILYVISFAIHNFALAAAPFFFLGACWFSFVRMKQLRYLVFCLLLVISAFVLLYAPVLYYFMNNGFRFVPGGMNAAGAGLMLLNTIRNFTFFSKSIFSFDLTGSFSFGYVVFAVFCAAAFLYFRSGKAADVQKKLIALLLFISVLLFLFNSLIRSHNYVYNPIILSLPVIFLSEILWKSCSKNILSKFVFVFLLLIFMNSMTNSFEVFRKFPARMTNYKQVKAITSHVRDALYSIKKTNGYQDFHFFQVVSYVNYENWFRYEALDSTLLVPLEDSLSTKLTRLAENRINYLQTGKSGDIILACYDFSEIGRTRDCTVRFFTKFSGYEIAAKLYEEIPVTIFYARKVPLIR